MRNRKADGAKCGLILWTKDITPRTPWTTLGCMIVGFVLVEAVIWFAGLLPFLAFLAALFVGMAAVIVLCLLFFLNAYRAVRSSHGKWIHAAFMAIVAIFVLWLLPRSLTWRNNADRQWFIRNAMSQYMDCVKKIVDQNTLTDHSQRIKNVVGHPWVFARTNQDGSITIMFEGRGPRGYPRGGYLYQSVNQPDLAHGVGYPKLLYLTNNWYLY